MKPLASTKVKGRQVTVIALKSGERVTLTTVGATTGTEGGGGGGGGGGAWVHRQAGMVTGVPPACVKQAIVMMSPQPAGLRGITDTL